MQEIPVGFRFKPSDDELVVHYLYNKIMKFDLPCFNPVKECDLYGDLEPWDIWEQFGGPSLFDQDLYFFTNLKKKNPKSSSSRIERTVGSSGGTWHGEDSGKTFKRHGITWIQKRFRYKNSRIKNHDGSHWIMIEYSILNLKVQNQNDLVLCRIRKTNERKRKAKSGVDQLELEEPHMLIHIDDDAIDDDHNSLGSQPKRLKALPEIQENQELEAMIFYGFPTTAAGFGECAGDDDGLTLTQDGSMAQFYFSIDDLLGEGHTETFGSEILMSEEVGDSGKTSTWEHHYTGEDEDADVANSVLAEFSMVNDASFPLQVSLIDLFPQQG